MIQMNNMAGRFWSVFIIALLSCTARDSESGASIDDLLGTWADKRIATHIHDVKRSQVFTPASGFWFSKDTQTGKPILSILYFERSYIFGFDTLIFRRNELNDYDSCIALKGGKREFLLLYNKPEGLIRDLQLLDTNILDKESQAIPKPYNKVSPFAIEGIEQYVMGKYLLGTTYVFEFEGRKHKVEAAFDRNFYRITGFPNYKTIQFGDWVMKDGQKIIHIFLADKGDFEGFTLFQKGPSLYRLHRGLDSAVLQSN